MTSFIENHRPAMLWKRLSEERRTAAASAFWADPQAGSEQAEVLGIIARQINFRPRSVVTLPLERKVRLLARNTTVSEQVAARLLVAYHLAHQRPMMKAFLDAVGLQHEDGLLEDDTKAPDKDVLLKAGRLMFETYPDEDVRLYFTTLVLQDPTVWGGLEELLVAKE